MKNAILLIGNGINNIKGNNDWKNLIENLIDFSGLKNQKINNENKPFPLLYEEVFLKAIRNKGKKIKKEIELKEFISTHLKNIQPNSIHEKIHDLNCSDILTTNYNYSLERVIDNKLNIYNNEGIIQETLYSLFRHNKIKKNKIWHIHGECNKPYSITLGYEHYSGYLQHMRNYIVSGTDIAYKNNKFEALIKRLNENDLIYYSWVDFFFLKNIYIIGLTLDFMEIHLWWLLTYRARSKFAKSIPIKNKITYFVCKNKMNEIINKIELLESNDIIIHPIDCKQYDEEYYLKILKIIKTCTIFHVNC
ncbi:MAG: hypothetical protein ACD_59C00110G0002 [uncultured bacterium]|nr:MAG: hypothetical protein ACD_59C00110G0002 [uncultured bacterium]